MSNVIDYRHKESVKIDSIKIPDKFIYPNKLHVDEAKAKLITGKHPVLVIGADNYLLKGYPAYIAYGELGYDSCIIVRSKEHTFPLHCEICGRECYTSYDIDKMDELHKKMVKRQGLKYTKAHIYSTKVVPNPMTKGDMGLCQVCNQLKNNMSYSPMLKEAILYELKLRGKIEFEG